MFKQFLALCSCSDSFVRARIMCLCFIRLLPPPLFSTLIQYFSNIFFNLFSTLLYLPLTLLKFYLFFF